MLTSMISLFDIAKIEYNSVPRTLATGTVTTELKVFDKNGNYFYISLFAEKKEALEIENKD